jgi:hypothetical protein
MINNIMNNKQIIEYYRPKISKGIEAVATDYYNKLHQNEYMEDDANTLLRKKLSKYGWKYLNGGYFSKVFVNPNKNYVLKINSIPDKGYETYVELIKHHRNPHFPIISDIKQLTINNEIYYAYLIEKLKPIHALIAKKYVSIFDIVINSPYVPIKQLFSIIPPLFLKYPKLVKALQIVGQNYGYYNLDLHEKNIMQRENGTIVITDPYA